MSIEIKKFESFTRALSFIEKFILKDEPMVFRGHQDVSWRLQTTLQRFTSIPYRVDTIEELLDKFRVNLSKLGKLPFDTNRRVDWLEYAQHHGVPTPYLDFSYSPYVALFFAFNELKYEIGGKKKYVALYALDVRQLASAWSDYISRNNKQSRQNYYNEFLYPKSNIFENGFLEHYLQFIPLPGSNNSRMQRQQGVFVYDTLNYQAMACKDLEEFIEKYNEPRCIGPGGEEKSRPTLTKILINTQCCQEAFQRLELMGITGTTMYLDSSGAAMDVKNGYYYNSKTMYARDLSFTET